MSKKKYSNKPLNIQTLSKEDEKIRTDNLYDEEQMPACLFPDAFMGSTASATESTGLMQNIAVTPYMIDAYDTLYNYRQKDVHQRKNGI